MQSTSLCLCLLVVWVNGGPTGGQGSVSSPTTTVHCGQQAALYRVVFHAEWSEAKFPKHYPKWRPNAQWSTLVGRSHSSAYRLFKVGSSSSDAVKLFSETGKTDLLVTEGQGTHGLFDEFYGPPVPEGVGISEGHFMVDSNHSKVSLMCRLVPSPDWFVGIDSAELCNPEKKSWFKTLTLDLDPLDAGTDNGFTFTAPNWDTNPRAKVTRITSHHPSHPANSFYYPQQKKLPRMGHFRLTLIKVFNVKSDLEGLSVEETSVKTMRGDAPFKPRLRHHPQQQQTVETEVDFVKHEDNEDLKRLLQDNAVFEGKKKQVVKEETEDEQMTNQIDTNKRTHLRKKFKRKHKKRPRPCRVSDWSEWSACSKTCGFGESFRFKSVLKAAQPGGQPCPPLRETRWCGSTRNCRSPSGYFVW